jgi:hypothetical protein
VATTWGPLVLEVSPKVLGAGNDMWQRYRLPYDRGLQANASQVISILI